MMKMPPNDILIIGLFLQLIGALLLANNYLGINVKQVELEGRLQFGGNSFDMKNKIIDKYHAWVGFPMVAVGIIISIAYIFLRKYETFVDLKGRSILFGSIWNTLATVAILFLVIRGAVFVTDCLSRKEYFPFLKEREMNNFRNEVKNWKEKQDNAEIMKDTKRGIDQLLFLFDIEVRDNHTYDMKIKELREKVFGDYEKVEKN